MGLIDKIKASLRKKIQPIRRRWAFKRGSVVKDRIKSHASYSGKYVLTVEPIDMGKGCWQCTRGTVKTTSGKKIAVIERNYGSFPHAFVEHHPDGHDYLICGEDYQGQTIIQLDTGKRVDYLPAAASQGYGFCWASIHPSPDGTTLAVEGCVWACPYEVVVYDFSKPMMFPYEVLLRDSANEEFIGWTGPREAKIGREYEVSTKYGKRAHELTDEEYEACESEEFADWKLVADEIVWKRA